MRPPKKNNTKTPKRNHLFVDTVINKRYNILGVDLSRFDMLPAVKTRENETSG